MTLIRSGQPAAVRPGTSPVSSATGAVGSHDSSTGHGWPAASTATRPCCLRQQTDGVFQLVGQGEPDRELDGQAALLPQDAQMRQPRLGGAVAVGADQDRRVLTDGLAYLAEAGFSESPGTDEDQSVAQRVQALDRRLSELEARS